MKSVLITGSSGFIAPHIIKKALERKYKVFGIDIKNPEIKLKGCNYIKKDVRDFNIEEIGNLDYIIHLAFVTNIPFSISDPISTTEDNILMTSALLKKATEAKIKTATLEVKDDLNLRSDIENMIENSDLQEVLETDKELLKTQIEEDLMKETSPVTNKDENEEVQENISMSIENA